MGKPYHRTVVIEGRTISYQLERKAVKNLNLRVRMDGSVYVSASPSVPLSEVDGFVTRKGGVILNALDRFQAAAQDAPAPKRFVNGETFYILGQPLSLRVTWSERESVIRDGCCLELRVRDTEDTAGKGRMMAKYLDGQCRTVFREILEEVYPPFQAYGVPMPQLRVREMKSRWGSCSYNRGVITLNKRLLEAPRGCVVYVVTHELCHFIHPNHSGRFYDLLTVMMPDWQTWRGRLNQQGL